MNHAISSLAKTEIIKQLGCFPAFLTPAIKSSLIYQSLVQQTLFAYSCERVWIFCASSAYSRV